MREFDILTSLPQPTEPRIVHPNIRSIQNRITASYRGEEFYDGDRNNGYGGYTDDGRWLQVAQDIIDEYHLNEQSRILQVECDKGFLLEEFINIYPKVYIRGIETSTYAWKNSNNAIKSRILLHDNYIEILNKYHDNHFDFVIALGLVYSLSIPKAIQCLKEIQRVGKGKSFITLGSFDTEEDEKLFRQWTLLGATILSKPDWIEVLEHCGYTGDYKFVTAKTLNLVEAS